MRTMIFRLGAVGLGTTLLASGCRDSLTPGAPVAAAPTPESRGRAMLVVDTMPNDSTVLVSLHVAPPGTVPLLSVSAAITYDTTQLRYQGEVAIGDGALRVANPVRGLLNTAAAHTTGFPQPTVATWRFAAPANRAAAIRSLTLQVRELRSADAANARPRTELASTVVTVGTVRP